MLRYKIDILTELKNKGFSTYVLRQKNLLGQGDITKLNAGRVLGISGLDRLCELLHRQPGQLLEWVPDPEPET